VELRAGAHRHRLVRGVAEFEEILGYHLEQAYRYRAELGPIDDASTALAERAARQLASAGRRALAQSDVSASVNLLSRAVDLLPPGDSQRLELLPDLGIALARSDISRADAVLTEAMEIAQTRGDRRLEARAGVRRVFVRLLLDPQVSQEGSLREVEGYVALFREWEDDLGLAEAIRLVGTIRFWQGRAASAEENFDRAIEHARRAGDRRQEAEILKWMALVIAEGPTPVGEGIRRIESIVGQGQGDLSLEIARGRNLATLEAMRGRFEAARALATHARALARDLGDQVAEAAALRSSGYVALLEGDPETAETDLRAGYEILDRIRDLGHLSSHAPDLGEALYALGRNDEALRLSEVAEQITIEGDVDAEVRWRQLRAKALARGGRHDEAAAFAEEAVRRISRTDYLDLHAEALLALAEVMRSAGRRSDAVSAAQQALALHRRKGNLVAERRAESLLDELGA
jgi:tetratricopeptide (TPR) repeat protein